MNKKLVSTIKMEKPEYYDSTDNQVAIIQKPVLVQELKKSFWNGLQFGSIIGTFGLSASLIFSLVTTQGYNNFFGIKGATWEAMFVLLATISAVAFGVLLFITIVKFFQGNFRESRITEQFFDGDKRINSK